jgi:hypothetical protein
VSFGTYARKVRDPSSPYGRRVNALAGCLQLYRPIGYLATFGYLEHLAGPLRRDEAALLRALEALSTSRRMWLKELSVYADRRREAKRLGRRSPPATESNPTCPACWYGDSRRAATFALNLLLSKRARLARADPDVISIAKVVLAADGNIAAAELEQVHQLRQRNERLRDKSGWPNVDWPSWDKANQSLWILHQIINAIP